ncbi:mitotic spindle assembly checkpoint protein MAD2A-like [Anopheles maculipalpis]|uniref:mitotic spindle assembly checkpoint protein MAD2A-like n=1 Tax=Anopheles maculipalpis TaxID=1496333 RepID=UPI0021591290|nr:mitotic spindle assembly checkpoint protein MAD2A-like [Anopheles maculipalpis]
MAASTTHSITLQGSASIIHEYLKYSINSIIFQRGIYPSSDFLPEDYNGVPVMVSRDKRIKTYLDNVLSKVHDLIMKRMITMISVCIITVETIEIVERWDFNITPQYDDNAGEGKENATTSSKSLPKIQKEIRDIMRQILASISFLPSLEDRCSFDVILHTKGDVDREMPGMMEEFHEEVIDSFEITDAQTVVLKQFSTGLDKVETKVVYRTLDP